MNEELLLLQKFNRLGKTRAATLEEQESFNVYSELSHLVYINGVCQELYGDESILHTEMQYMPVQDLLEIKHDVVIAGYPDAYELSKDILLHKCQLDIPEFNNDNLITIKQSGGALTFESLNPASCKKTGDCIGVRRLNLAEKLIWLLKTIPSTLTAAKRLEVYIEALVFDEDIELDASTSELKIIKTAGGKIAKLCFKQPTHGSIERFDLSDSIPSQLAAQQIIYHVPLMPFSDDLKTLSQISTKKFQAINVRDIKVDGVSHATIRYITNNKSATGDGYSESNPIFFGTYYASRIGKEMLLASAILRILYYLNYKYFSTESKPNIDAFKLQFATLYEIPSFFSTTTTTMTELSVYKSTTEAFDADLLRLDLFYLLLGKKGDTFGVTLSMNPLMQGLYTSILQIMKKLKITKSYVGAKDTTIRTDYPNAKADFTEDAFRGNVMAIESIVVDHLGPTGYTKNATGTDINCLEIQKTEYTLNNDILPIIKTRSSENDHSYCAIMSQLVYLTQDIVSTFFKRDCIYLGGFDEDPDWKIRGVSIKHRIHAWYQQLTAGNEYKIYIAVRGSHTTRDWVHADYNISAGTVHWYEERVHRMPTIVKKIQQAFANAINKTPLTQHIKVKMYSCGHSLGGLMALMFSYTSLMKPFSSKLVRNGKNITFVDYIYPVAFNPFCGFHQSLYNALTLLPCGHVYRVYGDVSAVIRYNCEDGASSMFRDASKFKLSVCQVYHSSWRISGALCTARGIKDTMTDAHIMFQFIGVIWAYIESLEHCRVFDGKRIQCSKATVNTLTRSCTKGSIIDFKDIVSVGPFYRVPVAPAPTSGFAAAIDSARAISALLSAEVESNETEYASNNTFISDPSDILSTLFPYPESLFIKPESTSSFVISDELKAYLDRPDGGNIQTHAIYITNTVGALKGITLCKFQKNTSGGWIFSEIRPLTMDEVMNPSIRSSAGGAHKKTMRRKK